MNKIKVAAASNEVRTWGVAFAHFTWGYPGHAVVVLAALWLIGRQSLLSLMLILAALIGVRALFLLQRRSFDRWVARPVLSPLWRWQARSKWQEICQACDLCSDRHAPTIMKIRAAWPRTSFVARPLTGQTYADFERAAEAIRLAFGASQLRIEPTGIRDVSLTLTMGNELAVPFDAHVPPSGSGDLDAVYMGQRTDGSRWLLSVGPHTLVAGASGSGKGSVFWSFAFALAHEVSAGRVQLHGVDLKGGMEVLMGRELFSTTATSASEAVEVLEDLVARMQKRTHEYAGRVRHHVLSVDEPFHVVMIDELAALTAYCSERDLQRRAEAAINLLCSQGRAPGFMVFACLQDPRKEVVPSRGLFTQMIGLRLKDVSETSMVLGESAVQSGAHCHRISRDEPGTGYVVPEDGGAPIQVRAGFASDDAIRKVATEFAAQHGDRTGGSATQ